MAFTKQMALREIATIGAGQTFRDRAEAIDSASGIRLLQIKDIREGRFIAVDALPYANLSPSMLKVVLKRGGVLLPLRGGRVEAMLFDVYDSNQNVTTTNQVAIIYPNLNLITPEYLLWQLNSRHTKQNITSKKTGSAIQQLSMKSLAELVIDVPPLAVQTKISEIYDNWQQQKKILNELLLNGETLTEQLCIEELANSGKNS